MEYAHITNNNIAHLRIFILRYTNVLIIIIIIIIIKAVKFLRLITNIKTGFEY